MEFKEAMTRLMDHKQLMQTEKQKKWRVSFHRSFSSKEKRIEQDDNIPEEFLCSISGILMNDPVIVSSGHTFERACVQACNTLGFSPTLVDGTIPDFSTVILNRAHKSAIRNWRKNYSAGDQPKALDFFSAEKLIRAKMESQKQKPNPVKRNEGEDINGGASKSSREGGDLIIKTPTYSYGSDDSVGIAVSTPPLHLKTRPSCFSSPSSSELEALNLNHDPQEEEFVRKLSSSLPFEVEEGLVSLRQLTRIKEESRLQLCTSWLLSALQPLIISRYSNIQVNSVACLVNLSLEKMNKVKIVRSGMVPMLIDALKGGFPGAKEHACGAIFSLALDDSNKTAIGVLGALPPLLHLLRSDSKRTCHDSASALYNLSSIKCNAAKLVKLGSVPILLEMVKSGHMKSRVLLILCNLALSPDGRIALCDSEGVETMVGLLRGGELTSESRESCLSVLYGFSLRIRRFKRSAESAGAEEVLMQEAKTSRSEWTQEKVKRTLERMKTRIEEDENDMYWEEVLDDHSIELRIDVGGNGKEEPKH